MLGHPDGYTAGAQAWQQAIASVMEGVEIAEYARRPEHKALRRALEKWGYLERPSTPWLRVAPKFHPKPSNIALASAATGLRLNKPLASIWPN